MLALPALVRAQAPLDEDPRPVGAPIVGDQSNVDVVAASEGRFLVVWNRPGDFGSEFVSGQGFDGEGVALTGEFMLTEDSYYTVYSRPRASWLGEGADPSRERFVVVWENSYAYGTGTQAEAQIIDVGPPPSPVAGDVVGVAGFFLGEPGTATPSPAIAADPGTGRFAAVWREPGDLDSIRGGWYDRDGEELASFDVDESVLRLGEPEIALRPDGSGTFVVTYPAFAADRSGSLLAKQFRADGGAVTEESAFQVNVYDQGFLGASAPVAYSASGDLFVVWQRCQTVSFPFQLPVLTDCGIFGRVNPAAGASPEIQVNSGVLRDQTLPRLAADDAGDFIAVWQDQVPEGDGVLSAVSLQRLRPLAVPQLGALFLDQQLVVLSADDPRRNLERPRVAALNDQRFVLVWSYQSELDPENFNAVFMRFGPTVAAKCVPDPATLCLNDDRFRLTARWRTPDGRSGDARPAQMTADAGYFWFFDRANVELVVKIVRGSGADPSFWVFAGGLTNLGVELEVTDALSGRAATYSNPVGRRFEPIQDTRSFRGVGPGPAVATAAGDRTVYHPKAGGGCGGGPEALCLNDDRFRIELEWDGGPGRGVRLSPDAGYFWFFTIANVEALFKVLDGCAVNGHYWVFAAGLTDLEVGVEVTDTATGEARSYRNPPHTPFRPILDTTAFRCAGGR